MIRMNGATDRGKKTIAVDSSLSSRTVKSHITVSRGLEKYLRHCDFFSCYDAEIVANNSILNIPALSVVLPFAWITGADVYVNELDRTFAESMSAVHREYKRMYPRLPFTTRLVADRLVDNKCASDDTALLFSGGLDATYSLFSNIALKPRLIMILGTSDIPISNVLFQKTLEKEYSGFAEREGLILSFIRTNALEILDTWRVDHIFGKLQGKPRGYYRTEHVPFYWNGIGYMLCHIGLAAPLSIRRFGHLIAATGTIASREYPNSWRGLRAGTGWASIRIDWHGEILRHEKASFLKEFLHAHRSKLRVCLESHYSRGSLNCSHCDKCLVAIAMLAAAGIDPNECGFSVDESTFSGIRRVIRHTDAMDIAVYWKPLQQAIPDVIELDRYGSRRFFKWLKRVDLDSMGRPYRSPVSDIYHALPYPMANILRPLWYGTRAYRVRLYLDLALTRPRRCGQKGRVHGIQDESYSPAS